MPYKQFTNGSPLPASDLQNFLMDQSVMTFANATARTAALATPKEGMVTWLEDSNRLDVWSGSDWILVNDNAASVPLSTVTTAGDLIVGTGNATVSRLGIGTNGSIPRVASGSLSYLAPGTNGQVLTVASGVPSWVTPAGGGPGNWTLITNSSFPTGGGSANITGLGGYTNYHVVVNGLAANGAVRWVMRMNSATTGYNVASYDVDNGLGSSFINYIDTSEIPIGRVTSGGQIHGSMRIFGANSTARCSFDYNFGSTLGNSNDKTRIGGGVAEKGGAALTSLLFIPFTGNVTGGTIQVYGA